MLVLLMGIFAFMMARDYLKCQKINIFILLFLLCVPLCVAHARRYFERALENDNERTSHR